MDYQKYVDITQQVSQAVDWQDYDPAFQLLEDLLMSDLPDIDKSIMCINLGVVWEKKGNPAEALRQYDRGIRYEKPHRRCRVQQEKVAYLLRLKRKDEALSHIEEMLNYSFLTLNERESYLAWRKEIETA